MDYDFPVDDSRCSCGPQESGGHGEVHPEHRRGENDGVVVGGCVETGGHKAGKSAELEKQPQKGEASGSVGGGVDDVLPMRRGSLIPYD